VPDKERATETEHSQSVREMFATIAARYDLLNHLLSGNIDRKWRRLVAKNVFTSLPGTNRRILDVACGTGDLSLTLHEAGEGQIVGIDFCRPMLNIAVAKALKHGFQIPFIEGDALDLPFRDRSFDGATIAFGLRNLSSVEAGFKELFRILRPGGRVVVLEFSRPRTPILRSLFSIYFTNVLPVFGGLISGSRSAYEYLPQSVSRFPGQEELASMMKVVGFEEVTFQNLTGGIAALHLGTRPD
jgi:demethylmenaquinone methyltransferase/2-methoxy-6-polyprenyl-1,4-benzoquinol methylase